MTLSMKYSSLNLKEPDGNTEFVRITTIIVDVKLIFYAMVASIRSFFWYIFSRIRTRKYLDTFNAVQVCHKIETLITFT